MSTKSSYIWGHVVKICMILCGEAFISFSRSLIQLSHVHPVGMVTKITCRTLLAYLSEPGRLFFLFMLCYIGSNFSVCFFRYCLHLVFSFMSSDSQGKGGCFLANSPFTCGSNTVAFGNMSLFCLHKNRWIKPRKTFVEITVYIP